MTYYELLKKDEEIFKANAEKYKDDTNVHLYYINCLKLTQEVLDNITVEEAQLIVKER